MGGSKMWEQDVAARYRWKQDVGARCGSKMCEQDVRARCGRKM